MLFISVVCLLSANFMSHDRQVGVNATHWKPLPWPRLSWAAEQPSLPASPCHTKEKRWRTSANSCQSCHALCRRLTFDKQLVEIPVETCRPCSPLPSAAIITSLFYMLIYFHSPSFPPFQTLRRAQDKSLITPKCQEIQLKSCSPGHPWWRLYPTPTASSQPHNPIHTSTPVSAYRW